MQPSEVSPAIHHIRLHGPWERLLAAGRKRVHLPREWGALLDDSSGAVTLARRFHRPTGLEGSTRVFVAVPAGWDVAVRLNGRDLERRDDRGGLQRFEMTDLVGASEGHELTVEFRSRPAADFVVAIEIDSSGG